MQREMNRMIHAVTLSNLSQDENLSASNKGNDLLLWNVRLIFANSCLPSSVQSVS